MTDFIIQSNFQDNLWFQKPRLNLRFSQLDFQISLDEVDNPDYRKEETRLQSYENWPVSYMNPVKLAAAGFYYTGHGDTVRCFECKVEICQWLEGDDPMTDHQRWQEQCRFIRKIPCGNVPIRVSSSSRLTSQPSNGDVCGPHGVPYAGNQPRSELQLPSTSTLAALGIIRNQPKDADRPEYASYDARLKTFDSWPKSSPPSKESIAEAGFFYTGWSDESRCYFCRGGLKSWEANDDPWTEHAKWFPKCFYVLVVKGQHFINAANGKVSVMPTREEILAMTLPSCIKKVEAKVQVETEMKSSEAGPSSRNRSIEEMKDLAQDFVKVAISETNVSQSSGKSADDPRLCKICYVDLVGFVCLPCGHMSACSKCVLAMKNCPICRQPFTLGARVFFS